MRNLNGNRFLVIGRAGLDLYAEPPGTKIEDALNFSAALGGSAANIAVALVRQGCEAALLTTVSDDAVGHYTLKALSRYGVSTKFIACVGGEARNSLAVVETRPENCQSVIYRNDAADFQMKSTFVSGIDYGAFSALIVTGTCLAKEPSRSATLLAMDMARSANLPIIIDVDYRPYSWQSSAEAGEVCLKAAELCDLIVANDEEFAVLAAKPDGLDLAKRLSEREGRTVIYKRGGKGCSVFTQSEKFDLPVFSVKALKPTGAGDAFLGGLLAALVSGTNLRASVRRAAATAAIVVTRVGCAPAMPDAETVHRFMLQASH